VKREKEYFVIVVNKLKRFQNFTVATFIEGCTCSDPAWLTDAASDFLRRLPASDVVLWPDGSIPYNLVAGDVYPTFCRTQLAHLL